MLFKKLSVWVSLLGCVLAVIVVMRVSSQPPMPDPPYALPAKPFARSLGAAGLVEASEKNTHVNVPAAGLVTQVFVEVWDKVEAGTPLFQLDDRELKADLLNNEAQVGLKTAQLERARHQFARLQVIDDPRAISAQDLQDRKLDLDVAEAELETSKATVEQTRQLLERLVVRSPLAGTVLQVNIRKGEYASPSNASSPLVIGNLDELWLRADIDEQIAPRMEAGQPAIGYLKGEATRPISMKFVRIEPYVIPKESLTGSSTERVDTRVLQVVYAFDKPVDRNVYVGQQMDLFIEEKP